MKLDRNDPCWCGSGKKWKKCHYGSSPAPTALSQEDLAALYQKQYGILLKTPEQIEGIRKACHLAAQILEKACAMAKKGVTTEEIDRYVATLHEQAGALAAPLGYGSPPYPKHCCISLNEVVCHGIPGPITLQEGDILNIDVTSILNGYFGDCSKMVEIGSVSEEKHRVCAVSYECLMRSIAILKPGVLLGEIGKVISNYAHAHGCSVVYEFVGHGVGVAFHEAPQVFHYANNSRIPLAPGMTFTIEPMINAGVPETLLDKTDRWTVRTADGKPSAQWEHTLLITEEGYEILTVP